MKKIDLHTHTTASDGILTPRELIDYARNNGVETIAITDHDTIDGLTDGIKYARTRDFDLIPGIEFSIDYPSGSLHLVGLYIDHKNVRLREVLHGLNILRDTRASRMVDDLNKFGINITIEEVEQEAKGGAVGRPHFARVLVRKGYANKTKEIFEKFLVSGKPGYVKKDKISLVDAVSVIKEAGGIPIIAHPISLNFKNFKEFESILPEFIEHGIAGIEVYAAMHSATEVDAFRTIALRNNLLMSGGSDFHGDKDEKIGYYGFEQTIPSNLADVLREYAKQKL